MNTEEQIRAELKEAHSEGHNPDASDLALLALVVQPGWRFTTPVEHYREDLNRLREVAIGVLASEGYCTCGTKIGSERCPSCSRLHK
jgi:hypothetical protein